ncbi:MAG: LLM class F420-dependent oxidoreductase [Terrimesophilobacter sp.]
MRFGIFIPQGWRHDLVDIEPAKQWSVMSDLASYVDAGPWESLWVFDHFHTVPVPTDQATHEAWTLMSAFAATTSRVRLGQMCTCMSYRNPVYLAKVAATIDIISGGRVEMGIGAGWYEHEWRAYGYGFPRPGERLARLDEGVQIMKQAWTTGTATLDGEHYQVDGAIVRPLPLQEVGIPIWVAGGGEKVTLRIAAQYADYTNFGAGMPEEFAAKSEILRAHCGDVGTDFDHIVRSTDINVVIGESESEVKDRLTAIEARWIPYLGVEKAAETIHQYGTGPGIGTPEQVIENLQRLESVGAVYTIHNFPEAAYDRSGIELFEKTVIAALKD